MKKRVFAVILGSVMAVSLMACGTKDEGAKDGTKNIYSWDFAVCRTWFFG